MSNPRYDTPEWRLLVEIQNTHYWNQDILSITGFMDDDQFIDHVYGYAIKHKYITFNQAMEVTRS